MKIVSAYYTSNLYLLLNYKYFQTHVDSYQNQIFIDIISLTTVPDVMSKSMDWSQPELNNRVPRTAGRFSVSCFCSWLFVAISVGGPSP